MYYTNKVNLKRRYDAIRIEGSCIEDRMQYSLSDTVRALNEQIKQTDNFDELMQNLPDDVILWGGGEEEE